MKKKSCELVVIDRQHDHGQLLDIQKVLFQIIILKS